MTPITEHLKTIKAKIMPDAYAPTTLPSRPSVSRYRRLAFSVYWQDAMPSMEIFYISGDPLLLRPAGIAALEARVLALLDKLDASTRVLKVVYVSFSGVEMAPGDVEGAGWRVLAAA